MGPEQLGLNCPRDVRDRGDVETLDTQVLRLVQDAAGRRAPDVGARAPDVSDGSCGEALPYNRLRQIAGH